jgi:hypothetical protein
MVLKEGRKITSVGKQLMLMSFPPPSRLIHIKDKERRERKDKNTGGGSERHK